MLHELQSAFRRALLTGETREVQAAVAPACGGFDRRFAVHVNTFVGPLVDHLAAVYPVVQQVVGDGFFRAAAGRFVRAAPPSVPQLWAYGGAFPDFLAGFEPAETLPYLPDLARLEWLCLACTFAAEGTPVTAEVVQTVPAEALASLRFAPAPSVRLMVSAWPVRRIWIAHQGDGGTIATVDPAGPGEAMLVRRVGDGVAVESLTAAAHALLDGLFRGLPLVEAAEDAGAGADLQELLGRALAEGWFGACDWDRS